MLTRQMKNPDGLRTKAGLRTMVQSNRPRAQKKALKVAVRGLQTVWAPAGCYQTTHTA
jgi:hypothetical protein